MGCSGVTFSQQSSVLSKLAVSGQLSTPQTRVPWQSASTSQSPSFSEHGLVALQQESPPSHPPVWQQSSVVSKLAVSGQLSIPQTRVPWQSASTSQSPSFSKHGLVALQQESPPSHPPV